MQNNNISDELSDTLSQEKVVNVIDKSKLVKSENIDSIKKTKKLSDMAEYRFEDYVMPKLEYNDLENGTKNEAFEYLWFANGLDKNGNMKPSKILEHLQNTDKISDLVDKLCKKSFSDQIDWHQDAKRLDLVWGMLESGNDHDAESYAHCMGIRQFSL
jgi:fructose-1,6-bisphosphatase